MILVDTSVWIDHFRRGNHRLAALLDQEQVLCHPFILGELACGDLRRRAETLELMRHLPEAPLVQHDEVLAAIELHRLMGSGIGWIDAHLLASTLVGSALLWTLDRRLARVATKFDLLATL